MSTPRTTTIVLVAVAAAIGGALWFAFGSGSDAEGGGRTIEAPAAGPSVSGSEQASPRESEPGALAEAAFADDALVARAEDEGDTRRAASVPGADTGSSARLLRIVEHGSGAPVSAAELRVAELDAEELADLVPWSGEIAALVEWLDREGSSVASDDDGVVRLDASESVTALVARSGDLFGVWTAEPDDPGPWTLELRRDRALEVLVVDTAGRSIPELELAIRTSGEGAQPRLHLVTDERGRALLPHADWILAARGAQGFEVEARALLREPVRVERDATIPDAPLLLTLPEVGRVAVAITTGLGEPWPPATPWPRLDLDLVDDALPAGEERASLRLRTRPGARPWSWVEIGERVEAVCYPVSSSGFALREQIDGPQQAFEEVRVDFAIGATHPVLRLRAIDGAGAPLAHRRLTLRTKEFDGLGNEQRGRFSGDSDADGVLLVSLERPTSGQRMRARLVASKVLDEPLLEAAFEVPRDRSSGIVDLGDVVLERAPLLVAGVVLDARDEPVAGAQVLAKLQWPDAVLPPLHDERLDVDPSDPAAVARAESRHRHFEQRRRTRRFDFAPQVECFSDQDGRFEVRSCEPVEALRLTAKRADGPDGEPVDVAPGSDVVLRVRDRTRVVGRVLLPAGLEAGDLAMSLREAGSGNASYHQLALDEASEWSVDNVVPGTWELAVADPDAFAWEPLAVLGGIEVLPGTTTRAPDLDLRSVLRIIELEVVDEHGAPILDTTGTFRGSERGDNNDINVVNGRARILTQHEGIIAWFGAPGHCAVRVERPLSGDRVVLPVDIPVEILLGDAGALPLEPLELVANLDSGLGQSNWVLRTISVGERGVFDATGRVVLGAKVAGTQSLSIGVRDPGRGSNAIQWIDDASWNDIEVDEGGVSQAVVIELDPQSVLDAVDRLRAGG